MPTETFSLGEEDELSIGLRYSRCIMYANVVNKDQLVDDDEKNTVVGVECSIEEPPPLPLQLTLCVRVVNLIILLHAT